MDSGMKERLASSTHYLRYFVVGGYIAFLAQLPTLLESQLTRFDVAILGGAISVLCIAMDLRNYVKFRQLTESTGFPFVSVLLVAFYLGCLYWFIQLPARV